MVCTNDAAMCFVWANPYFKILLDEIYALMTDSYIHFPEYKCWVKSDGDSFELTESVSTLYAKVFPSKPV